jgi:hypothetical protein
MRDHVLIQALVAANPEMLQCADRPPTALENRDFGRGRRLILVAAAVLRVKGRWLTARGAART